MEMQDILKTLRKQAKISQKELATSLGIGQATICQWESGKAKPTSDALRALCKYYNISANFLLGLDESNSGLDEMQEVCLGLFDNLTYTQKRLIIELMKEMKEF